MKQIKKHPYISLVATFFILLAVTFSCDIYNKSIPEYLDYYTNSATVGEQNFTIGTLMSPQGQVYPGLIQQNSSIDLKIRNPKSFELVTNLEYNKDGAWIPFSRLEAPNDYTNVEYTALEYPDTTITAKYYPTDKITLGINTKIGQSYKLRLNLNDRETKRPFEDFELPMLTCTDYPNIIENPSIMTLPGGTALKVSWRQSLRNSGLGDKADANHLEIRCPSIGVPSLTYTRDFNSGVWGEWQEVGGAPQVVRTVSGGDNYNVTMPSSAGVLKEGALYNVILRLTNEAGVTREAASFAIGSPYEAKVTIGVTTTSCVTLADAFDHIRDEGANTATITLVKDIENHNTSFTIPIPEAGGAGSDITLVSEGANTIQIGSAISLFKVTNGGTLRLGGTGTGLGTVTLRGISNNTVALVNVSGTGTLLEVNDNTVITGNTSAAGSGGGVYIAGSGATFHMNGGRIENNRAANGGGIYFNGAIFSMKGSARVTVSGASTAGNNDIYLSAGKTIEITGAFDGDVTEVGDVARITPTYTRNNPILTNNAFVSNYKRFAITNEAQWNIGETGLLQEIIANPAITIPALVTGQLQGTTATAGAIYYTCSQVKWTPDETVRADIPYTAEVTITITAGSGYTFTSSVKGTINGGVAADTITTYISSTQIKLTRSFTAGKEDPQVTWPTGLTATYGQTLLQAGVGSGTSVQTGTFEWVTPSTLVGTFGTQTHSMRFRPDNTADYNTLTNTISITVDKADPQVTWPTGLTATYGMTLQQAGVGTGSAIGVDGLSLTGTFAWFTATALVGDVGDRSHEMRFTPTDTNNYYIMEKNDVEIAVSIATVTGATVSGLQPISGNPQVNGATLVHGTAYGSYNSSATVTWSPNENPYLGEKIYTATITANVESANITFTGLTGAGVSVYGATSASITANTGSSITISAVFPETGAVPINIVAIPGVTAPVRGATPVPTITETEQYTGTVTWSHGTGAFDYYTVYTATITLTAKSGFTYAGLGASVFTVAGADSVSHNNGVVTAVFPRTEPRPVDIAAILGVTAPVGGATPVNGITASAQYTGTVTWSAPGAPNTPPAFLYATTYTATITLTPVAGYTLTGVTENFFTVAVATATNPANSGVVTAVFPATATPTININTHPAANTTVAQGAITGSLSVAATTSNSVTPTYQWYSNTTNSITGGSIITGATSASYTIPTTLTTDVQSGIYYYFCVVSTQGATSVYSSVATVTVKSVTVGTQTGTPLTAGSKGTTSFVITTANIANGQGCNVTWYSDSAGTITRTIPTGVTIPILPTILNNNANLNINTTMLAPEGTYYFRVTADSTQSAVATLTIGANTNPGGALSVTDVADLEVIRSNLGGNYRLTTDLTLSGSWTPINNFAGSFDGDRKTITFNTSPFNTASVGFFNTISTSGIVKNLKLTGTITTVDFIGYLSVGSVAAVNRGTIQNISSAVNINATADSTTYVGGLVADNYGDIINSYCTGNVDLEARISPYAGGIVGLMRSGGRIMYSWASGNVKGTFTSTAGTVGYSGGIVGNGTGGGDVNNCVALNGSVAASSPTGTAGTNARRITISTSIVLSNNFALTAMSLTITSGPVTPVNNPDGTDGGNFTPSTMANWNTTTGWTVLNTGGSETNPWIWDATNLRPKLWFE